MILHEKIVNPITITAVIPAAVRTVIGEVPTQIMPTMSANTTVKTTKIGSPCCLTTLIQHPITNIIATYITISAIQTTEFINIF
jgi:hypothetical protein